MKLDLKFEITQNGDLRWSQDGGCTWELLGPVAGNGTNGTNGANGTNGTNGIDGKDGVDGQTPYISESTGNWVIGDTDTGVRAEGLNGEVDIEDSPDIGVVGTPSVTKRVVDNKTILQFHELKGERGEAPEITAVRDELTHTIIFSVDGVQVATLYDDTHRPIEVEGSQILGNDLTALNLVAGDNITMSVSGGTVTIGAIVPDAMVFRGSLGTGGTITTLPVDGTANVGDTYKVITDGTYNSQAAVRGDLFICNGKTSSTNVWVYVPSGDDPSGTVTNVATGACLTGGPITTSGTIAHDVSGATAGSYGPTSDVTGTDTTTVKIPQLTVDTYGHVTAITDKTYTSKDTHNSHALTVTNGTASQASGIITYVESVTGCNATSGDLTASTTRKSASIPSVYDATYAVKTDVAGTETTVSDFTANQASNDSVTFVQGTNVTLTPDATSKKITIAATDTTYNIATSSTVGLVKSQTTGSTTGRDYNVEVNSNGTMKVNVPWTDTALSMGGTQKAITTDGTGGSNSISTYVPTGVIQMYAGSAAPTGWLLCTGDRILVLNSSTIAQTIQNKSFTAGNLDALIGVISNTFGAFTTRKSAVNGYIKDGSWADSDFNVSDWTNDAQEAYKFYSTPDCYYNGNLVEDLTDYYTLCLPNLQESFPVGASTASTYNLGKTGGEATHALTESEMPSHTHYVSEFISAQDSADDPDITNPGKFNVTSISSGTKRRTIQSPNSDEANYSVITPTKGGVIGGSPKQSAEHNFMTLSSTGSGTAHNNIPPYLAVNFIIKI